MKLKNKSENIKKDNNSLKLFMSIKETASYSGLSEYAIRKLINSKEIPYIEAGRKYLVDRLALKKYLEEKSQGHLAL